MDYGKFCDKLHAESRVGMAKNAYENHAHSDKWIFRKEESGYPFVDTETKATALLPREIVDSGCERSEFVTIEHTRPRTHYSAATAPWSGSTSEMGRILINHILKADESSTNSIRRRIENTVRESKFGSVLYHAHFRVHCVIFHGVHRNRLKLTPSY